MNQTGTAPTGCTLAPRPYQARQAAIATLMDDGLLAVHRDDLVVHLAFRPGVAARVHALVQRERECCPVLTFAVVEDADAVRLTITAPEDARDVADGLLAAFTAPSASPPPPAAPSTGRVSAVTAAAGVVACAACCVIPAAWPALVVVGLGGLVAARWPLLAKRPAR